jgi:outer membrane biosynthesis protein TonB
LVIAIQPIEWEQSFGKSFLPSQSEQSEREKTRSPGKCVGRNNWKNPVRLSSKDLMGLVLEKTPLNPPALLGRNNLHGIVKVEVLVNENGKVHCALGRSGHPFARDSAVRSVSKWGFKPYVIDGKVRSVTGILAIPYDFRR